MKIVILGGTGFIGSYLTSYLVSLGYQVEGYGREAFKQTFNLSACLEGLDAVIMLAGENIGKRWTARYKKALVESRTLSNQRLKEAIENCSVPPQRILSASAIGIYPENDCQHPIDESCQQVGKGFLGQIGQQWEAASLEISPKPVILRFGVVLGRNGGALQKMLLPFKMGLGGPVAGGKQCFSWIHIQDLARAIVFLITRPDIEGVVNLTSPNPISNAEFGQALAGQLNRPFILPLPEFQLKLMFGEGAKVLTHSSAIHPRRLIEDGFEFEFSDIQSALQALID